MAWSWRMFILICGAVSLGTFEIIAKTSEKNGTTNLVVREADLTKEKSLAPGGKENLDLLDKYASSAQIEKPMLKTRGNDKISPKNLDEDGDNQNDSLTQNDGLSGEEDESLVGSLHEGVYQGPAGKMNAINDNEYDLVARIEAAAKGSIPEAEDIATKYDLALAKLPFPPGSLEEAKLIATIREEEVPTLPRTVANRAATIFFQNFFLELSRCSILDLYSCVLADLHAGPTASRYKHYFVNAINPKELPIWQNYLNSWIQAKEPGEEAFNDNILMKIVGDQVIELLVLIDLKTPAENAAQQAASALDGDLQYLPAILMGMVSSTPVGIGGIDALCRKLSTFWMEYTKKEDQKFSHILQPILAKLFIQTDLTKILGLIEQQAGETAEPLCKEMLHNGFNHPATAP